MQNSVYVEKVTLIWGYLHNEKVFYYKVFIPGAPAQAGVRLVYPVRIVGMSVWACACVSASEAINNYGMIWTSYDWLNKFYNCYGYMATALVIVNGRGLGIVTRCRQ